MSEYSQDFSDSSETPNVNYNFLLLSIYYYLKNSGHFQTAEIFYKETGLDKMFDFKENSGKLPELKTADNFAESLKADVESEAKKGKNEEEITEKMRSKFEEFLINNTYIQPPDNVCFLSTFWLKFWISFANEMQKTNNKETVSIFDKEKGSIISLNYSNSHDFSRKNEENNGDIRMQNVFSGIINKNNTQSNNFLSDSFKDLGF